MERRSYCKRHPSHKQAQGVCPYCLRERLSYVSTSSSSSTATRLNLSDSSTTSSCPHSSDSNLSPLHKEEEENKPLKKSRSLAFVMDAEEEKEKGEKKKRRFWAKILMGRRMEGNSGLLHHSKTMKEKASAEWVVFP